MELIEKMGEIVPTKLGIEQLANNIASQVKEGLVDPIKAGVRLTAIAELCKVAKEKINDDAVEAVRLNDGRAGFDGAKVEICETGVKYDFSLNEEWVRLAEAEAAIAEKRKALEERLKKIPAGKSLVDNETGEFLIGPAKSSKTSIKVTLAKC